MKNSVLILLSFVLTLPLQGQDKVEQTKERAKNKSENRLDRKIDNSIDSGLDTFEGLFKKKGKKKKAKGDKGANSVKKVYRFGSNMKYEITHYKKGNTKKGDEMEFQYYFPTTESEPYLGMKMMDTSNGTGSPPSTMNILHNEKMLTFIDQEGSKMMMAISLPKVDGSETENEMGSFQKTGNSKELLGYNCEEYLNETPEYIVKYWLASTMQEQAKSMVAVFTALNKSANVKTASLPQAEMGMVLEMESVEKKNKDRFVMKVSELNLSQTFEFSTEGYKRMGIDFGQFGN